MEPELERSKEPNPRRIVIPSPNEPAPPASRYSPEAAPETITFERRTYARETCVILGVLLMTVGLVGFVMDNFLDAHLSYAHNVVHLLSGALAVWFGTKSEIAAKRYAYIFGSIYGLLGVLGFVVGVPGRPSMGALAEDRFLWRIVPEKLEFASRDHIIHLILGAVFLLSGLILFRRKKYPSIYS
ncbi:MAG: DUF4383 domain-containing protein [Bdellovibrio sp.]|nr:DUF4383 domain-containing protein [Bdellovibrio sp.]